MAELPDNAKIAKCKIVPPKGWGSTAKIMVECEGVEGEHLLLDYFDDEISFEEKELVGKTVEEAFQLKATKDKKYIESKS